MSISIVLFNTCIQLYTGAFRFLYSLCSFRFLYSLCSFQFTSNSSDHSGDMVEQVDENVDLLLDVPMDSNMVALMTTPVERETDGTRDDGATEANVPDGQSSSHPQREVETGTINTFKLTYLARYLRFVILLLHINIYAGTCAGITFHDMQFDLR